LFTGAALALIAQSSEGIPRNINNLCFNALSLGCALRRRTIDGDIVREVVADLDLEPLRERRSLAARPERAEKEDTQEVPPFVGAASAPFTLVGRLTKLAIAGVILFAVAGALFESRHLRNDRFAVPEAVVHADSVVPPLVAAAPSSISVNRILQPVASAGTVRVTAGKTLYRICVESFGSCTPKRLQEIHELNPRLSNLDHIESGQRLRIPVVPQPSGATQNIVEQPGYASLAEKGTQ